MMVGALSVAAQRVTGLSPQKARSHLDLIARLAPPVLGITRERTVVGGVKGEWLRPWGWRDGVTFMHCHGGGYALCSSITHRMMISDISRAARARGLSVDYRLAPEHPFPAAIDDCESAYDGLLQQGVDPRRLVLTGDSAGGALVLATLIRLRERRAPMPAACVLMSPWVDLACSGESMETNATYDYIGVEFMQAYATYYLDGESLENSAASPIHASLEDLPPMLIQTGGAEMLFSDIKAFSSRAETAGVDVTFQVWDGMVHAFQGFTFVLPEAREAMAAIGDYIQEKTGVHRRTSRLPTDSRRSAASSLPPHVE